MRIWVMNKMKVDGKNSAKTKKFVKYTEPITHPFVTEQWYIEYVWNGWGLTELVAHIVAQYGYISCGWQGDYIFEDVKMDATYHEMYPEIENKKMKASLWVKIKGEWYFVEINMRGVSDTAFYKKQIELKNYAVKGFEVHMCSLDRGLVRRFLREGDTAGAVREICKQYEQRRHSTLNWDGSRKIIFDSKEDKLKEYTHEVLESDNYKIVGKVTETSTGEQYVAMLSDLKGLKENAEWFKQKYEKLGLPMLYGIWDFNRYTKECFQRARLRKEIDKSESE